MAVTGPPPLDDLEPEASLRLWVVLARAYQSVSKAVQARVATHGLTVPQFGVLEVLYHLGPLSHRELADKLLVTGGNITFLVGRLEASGLIVRARSDIDRRVVEARLTPKGRALGETAFPEHARSLRDLMAHLDASEQATLRTLLKRLGKGVKDPQAQRPTV